MRRWRIGVSVYAVLIALILSLPTLSASLNSPPDAQYTGALVVPSGFQVDYYSHMAKLWHGAQGKWAYRLLFSTEPHEGLIGVQGFYVLLGALSQNPPYDFPFLYHAARFVFNVLLIIALGEFIARFFSKSHERWMALIFATLVTGWGWLMYSLVPALTVPDAPIEFWLMDAYHLTGGLFMPHFSAAALLQLLTLLLLDDWRQKGGIARVGLLTLVMAANAVVQPYIVLLMMPLCALYAFYTLVILSYRADQPIQRRIVWLAVPMAAQGVLAVAQYLALTSDPVWRNFTAQNITLSPSPIHYLFGYAPFLIPMIIALIALVGENRNKIGVAGGLGMPSPYTKDQAHCLIPILWGVLVTGLIYAPFPTQRRYLLGVQSALGMVAAWGWIRLVMPRFGKRRWLVTIAYMGSAMIALMILLTLNITGLNPQAHPEVYVNADEQQAAAWIRENTPSNAQLLTVLNGQGQGSGGRVVWLTGRTVYLGHWIETTHFASKVQTVMDFYAIQNSDAARQVFLQDNAIDVIWYDQAARLMGRWSPADADFLVPVFTSDTVTLYAPK